MRTDQVNARGVAGYPPEGKALALAHLEALQRMSASIAPTFLSDLSEYDTRFPAEQTQIRHRLQQVEADPALLQPFAAIPVPSALLENDDWMRHPRLFLQTLTTYLWSSGQMDRFREASAHFVASLTPPPPVTTDQPRLLLVLIGKDAVPDAPYPLFRQLRKHGQHLTGIETAGSAKAIADALRRRYAAMPAKYAHWYIDGDDANVMPHAEGITQLSYVSTFPMKRRILAYMRESINEGAGPEALRSTLTGAGPRDLGTDQISSDPRMQHFVTGVLTEGSGTQLFSTSFVQWAAREALRQAQPQTMFARFTPRQRQSSFNNMVQAAADTPTDPQGSLIDGDMAAWYLHLEMTRLSSPSGTRTVVLHEGTSEALVTGTGFPQGTSSNRRITLTELLVPDRLQGRRSM